MSSGGVSPAGGGAPTGAAGGDLGGTYPNPSVDLMSGGTVAGALAVHPSTDVVPLTITAAAASSSNLLTVVPAVSARTIAVDFGGRFIGGTFGFILSEVGGAFGIDLATTGVFVVESDNTGDFALKVTEGAAMKLGFFNTAPAVQPTAVADAAGGVVIDDEARAAVNALLARMRTLGLIDT